MYRKSIRAVVVKTDGSVNEVFAEWDYEQLSQEVGGYVEAVNYGRQPYFAYINEEGKLRNLEENALATELWYRSGQRILIGDYIAGDAVFFGLVDEEGDNTDAPIMILEQLRKIAWDRINK
jgi:Domain of unknown function (DUF3846)